MQKRHIQINTLLSLITVWTFIFVSFFSSIYIVKAQATLSGIVITTTPAYPIPDSNVTVNLETYQFDSDIANIDWYYNDKLIESGIGKKSINIKYPSLGQVAKVRVVARINDRNYVGGTQFGGSTVNILYEPINSYTPAWYAGSAIPAEGGKVKLYAEAYLYSNGKIIPRENLIYNWYINEEPQPNISGLGQSSPIIELDPIMGEAYVELKVKSLDGFYETNSSVRITPSAPELLVYYDNHDVFPLIMDYYYTMNANQIIINAEPFNAWIDKNNKYYWTLNGIPANNNSKVLPVRRSENKGQVDFNISFENKGILFQSGSQHKIINFE